jgi:hypothetical protein
LVRKPFRAVVDPRVSSANGGESLAWLASTGYPEGLRAECSEIPMWRDRRRNLAESAVVLILVILTSGE